MDINTIYINIVIISQYQHSLKDLYNQSITFLMSFVD